MPLSADRGGFPAYFPNSNPRPNRERNCPDSGTRFLTFRKFRNTRHQKTQVQLEDILSQKQTESFHLSRKKWKKRENSLRKFSSREENLKGNLTDLKRGKLKDDEACSLYLLHLDTVIAWPGSRSLPLFVCWCVIDTRTREQVAWWGFGEVGLSGKTKVCLPNGPARSHEESAFHARSGNVASPGKSNL